MVCSFRAARSRGSCFGAPFAGYIEATAKGAVERFDQKSGAFATGML
jgi:hypothetical protein